MQKATSSKTKKIVHRMFCQHTQFSVEAEKCSPAFTSKDGSLRWSHMNRDWLRFFSRYCNSYDWYTSKSNVLYALCREDQVWLVLVINSNNYWWMAFVWLSIDHCWLIPVNPINVINRYKLMCSFPNYWFPSNRHSQSNCR